MQRELYASLHMQANDIIAQDGQVCQSDEHDSTRRDHQARCTLYIYYRYKADALQVHAYALHAAMFASRLGCGIVVKAYWLGVTQTEAVLMPTGYCKVY